MSEAVRAYCARALGEAMADESGTKPLSGFGRCPEMEWIGGVDGLTTMAACRKALEVPFNV